MGYGQLVQKYNYRLIFAGSLGIGSIVEFIMIKFRFGETNFYDTFREKEVKKAAEAILEREQRNLF